MGAVFPASTPLLMATSASGLGRKRWSCPQLSCPIGWLGSRVVSVLGSGAEAPGSNRSRDAPTKWRTCRGHRFCDVISPSVYRFVCCRCRSGSLPAVGESEPALASSVSRESSRGAPGVALATVTSSSSSSRQSNDSAYDSLSLDGGVVSPRPSLALRHLIRSTAPPSHVAVRTGGGGGGTPASGLGPLATAAASPVTGDAPAPASDRQRSTSRPGSAQRFRNMVLQYRDMH